jgi:hypothetical protein
MSDAHSGLKVSVYLFLDRCRLQISARKSIRSWTEREEKANENQDRKKMG